MSALLVLAMSAVEVWDLHHELSLGLQIIFMCNMSIGRPPGENDGSYEHGGTPGVSHIGGMGLGPPP